MRVAYVDGKGRHDGVRGFVCARGIELPEANPTSPADEWSVHGIANGKQALVEEALAREPVAGLPGFGAVGATPAGGGHPYRGPVRWTAGEPVGEEPPPAA